MFVSVTGGDRMVRFFRVRNLRSEKGGAMIELGLMLPLLVMMAVGATNIGFSLGEKQMLVEAARYGARRGGGEGLPTCSARIDRELGSEGPGSGVNPPPPKHVAYVSCATVLENPPLTTQVEATSLAGYYTCQHLKSSGKDAERWEVRGIEKKMIGATEEYSVLIELRAAQSSNIFISSLMGDSFPGTRAQFLIGSACRSDSTGDGDWVLF